MLSGVSDPIKARGGGAESLSSVTSHQGSKTAIPEVLPGASWQRRNVQPKKNRPAQAPMGVIVLGAWSITILSSPRLNFRLSGGVYEPSDCLGLRCTNTSSSISEFRLIRFNSIGTSSKPTAAPIKRRVAAPSRRPRSPFFARSRLRAARGPPFGLTLSSEI